MTPERPPENPHRITFSLKALGIHTEVIIDSPIMESLPSEDRTLLQRLVDAQSYSLALLMKTREHVIRTTGWRNHIIGMLDEQNEAISNIDAEIDYKVVADLLGVDLKIPPSEPEIYTLPSTGTA